MQLRKANGSDTIPLMAFARRCFEETFTHYARQSLNHFLDTYYSCQVFAAYIEDPEREIWIAEESGMFAGYGSWGKPNLPIALPYTSLVELHRLYIAKSHQGKQLGRLFMDKALAYAHNENAQAMILGVWEKNTNAQRFYAHYGFIKAGEYDYPPIGDVVDREWIMVRKL